MWFCVPDLSWISWSLCFIAILFVIIVLWFLFSLFLGFALHNIHTIHSRLSLFFFSNKKKMEEKGSKLCFALFFLVLKTRLVILFSHNMSFVPCLALICLLIAPYLLKLCGAWCVGKIFMVLITLSWSWSHMSLTVGFEHFERRINNHLTNVH